VEFHIRCDPKDIARYVFVPGDHDRARKIADRFDKARLVSDSRGYMVYSGTVLGFPMTVCSTGMGGPQVGIGMEELGHMGADTFIRVGSCGTFQAHVQVGDLVIPSGVYRGGETANRYLPPPFPAAPHWQLLSALVGTAEELGLRFHVGIGSTWDAFYALPEPPLPAKLAKAGVLAAEMECDTLFIISAYRGWRAGAVLANDGTATEIKPEWGEEAFRRGEAQAIQVAIEAMTRTARADQTGER
jgi:uridine phosphorylase